MMDRIVCLVILGAVAAAGSPPPAPTPTTAPATGSQPATRPARGEIDARFAQIAAALRPRTATVDVIEPVFPEEFSALSKRLARGVAEHAEWWKTYSREHHADEGPVPYHANLGLSEEEYAKYVRLSGEIRPKTVASIQLVIQQIGGSRFSIQGPPEMPDLEEILVDLESGTISTPVGETAGASRLGPTAKLTGLGDWRGFQWKAAGREPEAEMGWTMQFAIGHIVSDGRAAILYTARKIQSGRALVNAHYLLVFPAEGAASRPAGSPAAASQRS